MNKEINYPIKYAVLELKEMGGWSVGYQRLTQGFIVSKCYVIESNIIYNSDGSHTIKHKVVFPYIDIETFSDSLKHGKQNIGKSEIPKFDACSKIYLANIVDELFDNYEDAKVVANNKNDDYKHNILSNVPAPRDPRLSNDDWVKQFDKLSYAFEKKLEICNLFEQVVLKATEDMVISEEQKSSVKVLKPIKMKI